MNELQTFNFEQNSIRTVTIDDKIYFVAKDVAETLGFKNPRDAIIRHCRGVVKYDVIDSLGRMQETTIIPESGQISLAQKIVDAFRIPVLAA